MTFDNIYLGQHWPRQWLVDWWQHIITWTNVDLSSVRSMAFTWGQFHKRYPSHQLLNLKIIHLKSYQNLPGAKELNLHPTICWLTHWGRVKHICVSRLTITGSDNGLSPGRRQAIMWTNAGILLIGPNLIGQKFHRNSSIFIHKNTIESVVCETVAILSRPQCVNYNKQQPQDCIQGTTNKDE